MSARAARALVCSSTTQDLPTAAQGCGPSEMFHSRRVTPTPTAAETGVARVSPESPEPIPSILSLQPTTIGTLTEMGSLSLRPSRCARAGEVTARTQSELPSHRVTTKERALHRNAPERRPGSNVLFLV